ncbi:hypothetical protein FOZ63_032500 [Perkinsus olseni]|nr:hypothetical protein FOZ63_032500 [Perkinsus olseni]
MSCCPTDKTQAPGSGYQPKGSFATVAGLKCYTVGSGNNGVGILAIYDIFGMHSNTCEEADRLSEGLDGSLVVAPDFFHGKPWPAEKYPPNTPALQKEIGEWLGGAAAPTSHVEPARAVAKYMIKDRGVKKLGTIGHCWGAKVGVLMGTNPPELRAHAGPHPSFLTKEDGMNAKLPALYLETKDDNLADFEEGVREAGVKNVTVSKYKETFHGFMAGRGDWTQPDQKEISDRAMAELINFYKKWLL